MFVLRCQCKVLVAIFIFIYIVVALARLGATFIEFGAALKVFSTEYVFGAHRKTDRQTDRRFDSNDVHSNEEVATT